MSIGEGVEAVLIENSELFAIYQYCGWTLNDPARRERVLDGKITILKQCFADCDTKKIVQYLACGWLHVENCSNCWHTTNDTYQMDIMAAKLLRKLFGKYAEQNEIPAKVFLYY